MLSGEGEINHTDYMSFNPDNNTYYHPMRVGSYVSTMANIPRYFTAIRVINETHGIERKTRQILSLSLIYDFMSLAALQLRDEEVVGNNNMGARQRLTAKVSAYRQNAHFYTDSVFIKAFIAILANIRPAPAHPQDYETVYQPRSTFRRMSAPPTDEQMSDTSDQSEDSSSDDDDTGRMMKILKHPHSHPYQ